MLHVLAYGSQYQTQMLLSSQILHTWSFLIDQLRLLLFPLNQFLVLKQDPRFGLDLILPVFWFKTSFKSLQNLKWKRLFVLTFVESRGMIRKPEGSRGASSAKEASIGANISSAHVPTAFSSMPLQSYSQDKCVISDQR